MRRRRPERTESITVPAVSDQFGTVPEATRRTELASHAVCSVEKAVGARRLDDGTAVRRSSVGVVVERSEVFQRRSVAQSVVLLHTPQPLITASTQQVSKQSKRQFPYLQMYRNADSSACNYNDHNETTAQKNMRVIRWSGNSISWLVFAPLLGIPLFA